MTSAPAPIGTNPPPMRPATLEGAIKIIEALERKMNTHTIRIVPALGEGGPQPTRGTLIFAGDTQIDGVTGITIRADLNDLWRATIECHIQPPAELLAAAVFEVRKPETWLRRMLRWINGEPRNVTTLGSSEMEWER